MDGAAARKDDRLADERMNRRIRVLMASAQIDRAQLASMLGMSRATLWKRLRHPSDFTVAEIRTLSRIEKAMGGGGSAWDIGS